MIDHFLMDKGSSLTAPEKDLIEQTFDLINDSPPEFLPKGLFFKELYDLWMYVKQNLDPSPIVIDSDDLLTDPGNILAKYCESLGIPYKDKLLSWDGSPDVVDKWVTIYKPCKKFKVAEIYFQKAFGSTHFLGPTPLPSEESLTSDIRECVRRAMPFYQEMYAARIQP